MKNVRRSLLRSRRDKVDDEDLSRNVGGQARCELERQARIDRLKDGLGQRLRARAIHRLHIVDLGLPKIEPSRLKLNWTVIWLPSCGARQQAAMEGPTSGGRSTGPLRRSSVVMMIWSE